MKFIYTDFHVHTNWSLDIIENGPKFEDYISIAEKNRINLCFLDHFELYYIEKDRSNPFSNQNVYNYLEKIDQLKETYDFILSGLEVDYYVDRETELQEFMDDTGKELDFVAGAVHEWIPGYPITLREKVLELMSKIPVKQIIDEFFVTTEKLIHSGIFKNICHIDTVFRYINENDIKPPKDCDISNDRVIELGRICKEKKISVEYNLSGFKFPIKRTFPSKDVVSQLKEEGLNFFVGSDSHSLDYFEETIPKLKKAHEFLNLNYKTMY
jgi:HisJ family histidinol phosphate phosphatase